VSSEADDAARAARAENEQLHALLSQVPAAIAIVRGPEHRYELSNALNQELAGGRELVGKTVREALPELAAQGIEAMLDRVYRTGDPMIGKELRLELPGAGGRPARTAYLSGVYQPLRNRQGRVDGVLAFAYEVTEQVVARTRAEEAEHRLRLAVESADIGTWEYYPEDRVLTCDTRYRALFGLSPDAEVTTALLMDAVHPDDRERVTQAVQRSFDPSSGGEYAVEYRTVGVEDGLGRWISVRGRTFFDEAGKPRRFTGTGLDITAEKHAAERLEFLATASEVLSASLEYRSTLIHVAHLVVPRLADWCLVDIIDEQGELERLTVAHVDPEKVRVAEELRRRYPLDLIKSATARVLASGKTELVAQVTDEMLMAAASDEEHLRMLRTLGLRSYMLVPLRARDRTFGVLALVASARRFGVDDQRLAEELAVRAAVAVDHARLFEATRAAVHKRDEFLSIASHELKTPLTSLQLYLDAFTRDAQRGTLSALDQQRLTTRVEKAAAQVVRLVRLVNELLDVSRASNGQLVLQPAPMDVAELARTVAARFKEQAAQSGVELVVDAGEPIEGRWDRDRLDQVLTNLISNALKYAPRKPVEIQVTKTPNGRSAALSVRDQGPGIRPEDQQRIFERFERTAEARNLGGMGLGLWITRQIVSAHQGTIVVDSVPGRGATFAVEIPFDALAPLP
jgi:PAS domain S-box-containing protein